MKSPKIGPLSNLINMARREIARMYFLGVDRYKNIDTDAAFSAALSNINRDAEMLEAFQTEKVVEIVNFARSQTEFYKKKYDNHELKKFSELPIVEKADLLAKANEFHSYQGIGNQFVGSTSGSTGTSLVFAYDSPHAAWVEAAKLRGRRWFGVERGDSTLVLWGRPLARSAYRRQVIDPIKSALRNEYHFNTFNSLNEQFIKSIYNLIQEKHIAYIYGYGSSLAQLARFIEKRGLELSKRSAPKLIHFTADHLSSADARLLRDGLGAIVASDYGASEAPGIALECGQGFLHVSIDCYKIEFLDSNGVEVADNQVGDIVVTALHNRAMPLIRYKIGDLGMPIGGLCECGNPMPRMKLITGKTIDIINTSFVKGVSAHYLDYINLMLISEGKLGIRQFKMRQIALDIFELHVVPGLSDVEISTDSFIESFRERVGPVKVALTIVDRIPSNRAGKQTYFETKFGR